jgi:hypothetical protein
MLGRRCGLVFGIIGLVGALFLGLGSPAGASDQRWVEQVQARILKEAEVLARDGFRPVMRARIDMTQRSDARRYVVRLEAGATYAMIGACDLDCRHVALEILDDQRQPMTASREEAAVVILSGTPDRAGHYEVELTMPGCRERNCHAGFVVMRRDGGEGEQVLVATSVGPRGRGPAVAGAAIGMERRPGVEILANNYVQLQDLTLADCERKCLADRRCRALEFYAERRSCGLFDRLPPMQRARGVHVSVKSNSLE